MHMDATAWMCFVSDALMCLTQKACEIEPSQQLPKLDLDLVLENTTCGEQKAHRKRDLELLTAL